MFERLRDKALNLAEAGVSKAKEVGEIAKLNIAIAAEEESIKKAYIEIGRLHYAEAGNNPAPAYAEYFAKIGECKAKIEFNKVKIAELKADDNKEDVQPVCTADATPPPAAAPAADPQTEDPAAPET